MDWILLIKSKYRIFSIKRQAPKKRRVSKLYLKINPLDNY